MFPQNGLLIVSLCLVQAAQGLYVSMNRTHDANFCARLKCAANVEDDIQSIVRLTIYEVTLTHRRFKLASVSVFEPSPQLEQTRSDRNVTGAVSGNYVELVVEFSDESECLYGSFLCELNFLNTSGQPAVVTELTSPEGENLDSILLPRIAARLEAHSADVNKKMGILDAKFDNLLSQLVTLEQLRNESYEIPQLAGCYKGMPRAVALVKILLWNNVEALCDTRTDGGGWIIFQRRKKGDVSFYRNWVEYKNGFGSVDTDYWLGNDVISNLTSLGYNELRVDLKNDRRTYFAHYSMFYVANETVNYQLTVSGYDGTAGDGLSYHNNQSFSTYDRDNDNNSGNCAVIYSGAWWYNNCYQSNLNGHFGVRGDSGTAWNPKFRSTSADFTEMKIRQA